MRAWADPNQHGWVTHPATDDDWARLIAEYGGEYPQPFRQVVEVVRAGGCRTVVIENRYIDLDYRSEYSAFWSMRFESPSAYAQRMHFFREIVPEEALHRVAPSMGYLGYSVLRPLETGRVGRTVLTPPPELDGATLAVVDDEVSLFGNPLHVRGVPFCQQDAEYIRCAQAAAWICHYTAHRRGLVGRQSTAALVQHTPAALSMQRALPSPGMTLNQLQAVFGALGQPALFYGLTNMPRVRGVHDPAPALVGTGARLRRATGTHACSALSAGISTPASLCSSRPGITPSSWWAGSARAMRCASWRATTRSGRTRWWNRRSGTTRRPGRDS